MAYTDMALPLDVTWRRLAASWDMMDREPDRRFPPKWRSTISVFCYEPPELPEAYCERAITYLKIVCSITGFQSGAETALELPDDQPFGTKETELGARYYACYGALLQVSVFPGGGESVPLADYPYIIDFEPKRRELYEAVTQSGEILGRSTSALNVRKGATSGETTEISSKIGAEVKGSYFGLVEGRVTGEHAWGGGTHTEEQNVRTTDDSRERRETYSATTSLTQMYELFTGYHLGANRALFYMNARPHTVEDKDRYTFVNGPRRLEGIQEVFVIVNRPRDQKSLCVEAYVETGHLDLAETAPASTDPKPVPELEPKETTLYWLQESVPAASGIVLHKTVLTLGKDCKLDTTRGGGLAGSRTVPSGISVVFRDDDTANEYLYSITLEPITGDDIVLTLTFPEVEGLSVSRKLSIDVTVFYLCPGGVAEPTPRPPAKLFLTARGVRACVKLTQEETSAPATVFRPVRWEALIDPANRAEVAGWLAARAVDLREGDDSQLHTEDYGGPGDGNDVGPEEFKRALRRAYDRGQLDQLPPKYLRPTEWLTYEAPVEVSASLQDPDVPARQRLRAANDLSERISRGLVESLGSRRRYADHTVDYWHSDVVLDELTTVATELPDDDPANLRVADVDVPYKEQLLAQFGAEARLKQPATHGVPALARRLGIEPTAARVLKLALFARFVPPPQIG